MVNKVYFVPETSITWSDSGGDETLTLAGLASDGVRIGDTHDFGTGSRSRLYEWRLVVSGFEAAPVIGESVDAYLSFAQDTTYVDGSGATVDGDRDGNTNYLPNYAFLGSSVNMSVDPTAVTNTNSGFVNVNSRYAAPVIHNNTATQLKTSVNHYFILTPVPDELQ